MKGKISTITSPHGKVDFFYKVNDNYRSIMDWNFEAIREIRADHFAFGLQNCGKGQIQDNRFGVEKNRSGLRKGVENGKKITIL